MTQTNLKLESLKSELLLAGKFFLPRRPFNKVKKEFFFNKS